MLHLIQIQSFRFDEIHIETNHDYKKNNELPIVPAETSWNFKFVGPEGEYNNVKLKVFLLMNASEQNFKITPYRIKLEATLNLIFPPKVDKESIFKAIEVSGFHLLITTLRAYLADFTSAFKWGEYLLPTLDLTQIIKDFLEHLNDLKNTSNNKL
jgi:hypothetical protein